MNSEYSREIRFASKLMDRALEEFAGLSDFYLKRGRLDEICYQSKELLHELGEEESVPDSELDGNGDSMKGLIKGLRKLVLAEERLPRSGKQIRADYRQIMENLQDVREMLQSVYQSKE